MINTIFVILVDPITPSSSGITIASESDEEFSSDSGKEEEADIGKPRPVKHVKVMILRYYLLYLF